MQWNSDMPDPESFKEVMLVTFANIQKEIFINLCKYFFENVENSDTNIYKRANEFSKDFNNFDLFQMFHACKKLPEKLEELNSEEIDKINEEANEKFSKFCDYVFDFMNYIRKVNPILYKNSMEYAVSKLNFSDIPTLQMNVMGCASSIFGFLEMRDSGKLGKSED